MTITHSFQTGEAPTIFLQYVRGDLFIQGWPQPEVTLAAENATANDHTATGGTLEVCCDDDCRLQVPFGASIHGVAISGDVRISQVNGAVDLDSVNGDLQLKAVGRSSLGSVNGDFAVYHAQGDVSVKRVRGDAKAHIVNGIVNIESVSGDLRIQHVNGALVGSVSGDLTARDVHGDFHIENVGSDANVSNVEGSFVASSIGDDLTLADISGDVQVTVGDDVSLRLIPQAGSNYVVFAGGDAACRVPYECNATVTLQAGGAIGVHRLPAEPGDDPHHSSFTLGDGGATMAITAGGDISLGGSDMKWNDESSGVDATLEFGLRAGELAQQVASQIEMQVQAATGQLDKKLTELANNDDLVLRIQDKVQAALGVAEVKIAEAMRQAEQSMKEAQARAAKSESAQRRQQQAWKVSTPAKPAKPASPPVSDEERLIILGMVDAGKISVEQAEQLLQALRPKSTK